MIRKSRLLQSFVLIVSFSGVLVLMFMPLFDGQTPLQFADSLYNSISKGSAYFIPAMKKTAARYDNTAVSANLVFGDEDQARQVARLFEASGAQAAVNGRELKVNGNLGRILASSLEDCDAMYHNEEARVQSKYGYDARAALYNWWAAFHELQRELKTQNHFQQAKTVSQVVTRGLECSYNYLGVKPEKIGDRWGVVAFTLSFYVIYTLWYGFAILFLFEGLGLKLSHH